VGVETRLLRSFSHAAVAHIRTSFSHFPLSERPAILGSLICNETDNNKCNNRDTSKDTQPNREHLELPARYLILCALSFCSRRGSGDDGCRRTIRQRRRDCDRYGRH